MALDASEIVVAGTGAVYRAPVGTAPPSTLDETPDPDDWTELGYVSEDGAKFTFERSTEEIKGWQSYYPLRVITTEVPISVEVSLLQWNNETIRTAMGGGAFLEDSGATLWTPPDESYVDEFSCIVEGQDGPNSYRFLFRRVMISDAVEFSFVRSEPVALPLSMKILASPDTSPGFGFWTNAASIVPDASS